MTASAYLSIDNISIGYAQQMILENLSLQLLRGEIGCLLGSSGCGKTTLLRSIAGFETPQSGTIRLNNKELISPQVCIAAEKRGIGLVFQDFALFPHLTIEGNIGFGLTSLKGAEKHHRITEMLQLVDLEDTRKRYPHQLSGGQQQRIALARALAPEPELLLMDEPFSSLDVELREQLALDIRAILKQQGISALVVTHDQNEAFMLSDKIGLMHQGKIVQWSSPYDLYHKPVNDYAAGFIGKGAILPGTIIDSNKINTVLGTLNGSFDMPEACRVNGCQVNLLIRPDDVIHDDSSDIKLEIVNKVFKGDEFIYTLKIDEEHLLLCNAPSHHNHKLHSFLGIRMEVEHIIILIKGVVRE